MRSIRDITKAYNKLIDDVKTKEFYTEVDLTNRVNCYTCDCGHVTKTKDVDAGVTPFIFSCEKCNGEARSSFFNDIAQNQTPTIEWYRPTLKEVLKMRKKDDDGMLDHVLQGGLEYRKIKPIVL